MSPLRLKSVTITKKSRLTLADFPEIAAQLHPIKNGDLVPEQVAAQSRGNFGGGAPKAPIMSGMPHLVIEPRERVAML